MNTIPVLLMMHFLFFSLTFAQDSKIKYPESKIVDTVDNYHGTLIKDSYRWLEDNNSEETKNWIEHQNTLTNSILEKSGNKEKFKNRLTELWNYEKFSAPRKIGNKYIFSKNDGLQEQSVIYIQKDLNSEPEVFIDPNNFSEDGTVSLAGIFFSNDYKYCAYMISRGGSDWREVYIMDVETKELLKDKLVDIKFSSIAWYKDGFYYSKYDIKNDDERLKAKNDNMKVYYHIVGTEQSEDKLILEDKENPQRSFSVTTTDDERYLIISVWTGSSSKTLLMYKDLEKDSPITYIIDKFESQYSFIDNIEDKFLVLTDKDAPNYKLVMIDPQNPMESNWEEIITEKEIVLNDISVISNKIIAKYLKDANSYIEIFDTAGKKLYNLDLPAKGIANGFYGKKDDEEVFFTFESFVYPPTIYKYNVSENKYELFKKAELKFDLDEYETEQIFYESKDGTKIPLFITKKKNLVLDGNRPTLLYAYGGFNIPMTPGFRVSILPILENDGVYAQACLRGGSEYGEEWHKAGMLDKKQNVFDDFISAAEYLIENKYTNNKKLAIYGGSNGGLLVGAVLMQRPELFGVAFPAVGVLDMLRFHKFTIGWAWVSEYGSSENPEQFNYLLKYSPLHNVKNVCYPPTMITTADHDDRVFPAHSFKFAAEMQNKQNCGNPILIRVETKAGHGAGTSTSKMIDLYSDMWSFMFYYLNKN